MNFPDLCTTALTSRQLRECLPGRVHVLAQGSPYNRFQFAWQGLAHISADVRSAFSAGE
jgi:hypothetical protein